MATPGPYHVVEKSDTFNVMAGRRCIARLQKKAGAKEDADLLAASPYLLTAAKQALAELEPLMSKAKFALREAISEAEGE